MAQQSGLPILNPDGWAGAREGSRTGVLFTFDDGTRDHFEVVRPLLRQYGVRALFYVSTAKLNRAKYLTSDEVRALSEEGHTIGSHSNTHRRLDVLPLEVLREELELSATAIQNVIGQRPIHFAPPGGFYNSTVERVAQEAGYSFCRTMDWGYNRVFNPMRIEGIPMIPTVGSYILKNAIQGRSEWKLKIVCSLKNGLRTSLSNSGYNKLRSTIQHFGSGSRLECRRAR
jgi:peptidoglycan/xylan/chitin deacetylase (PgdA/CDA1 family)